MALATQCPHCGTMFRAAADPHTRGGGSAGGGAAT